MKHRFTWAAVPGILLLLGVAFGVGGGSGLSDAVAAPPPPTPIAGPTTRLPGHVPAATGASSLVASTSAATAAVPLSLTIVLHRDDEAGFQQYLADVQDPASPNYRHFLTPADLTARFGPSQKSYDAVLQFLQNAGFTLVRGSDSRLTISVRGTRTLAEQAFAVRINDYHRGTRSFFANDGDPAVPQALAPLIHGILGLSDLARPEPAGLDAVPATGPAPAIFAGSYPTHVPQALATAYDFGSVTLPGGAPATGAGETVALVEFDSYSDSDVKNWLSLYGPSGASFSRVSRISVDGGVATPGSNQIEDLLDIDTVLGMAPGANIDVLIAPNGGASFADMFSAALDNHVNVVSTSWDLCEGDASLSYATATDSVLQQLAAAGIAAFTASGDSQGMCSGTAQTTIPADSPNGVAVGGTTLGVNGDGSYAGESWWGSAGGTNGGGYGVSTYFSLPKFQQPFITASGRTVPDVSADADPNSGILVCQGTTGSGSPACGQWGGTSMATPEWAAGMALITQALNTKISNPLTVLYAHPNAPAFHPASTIQNGPLQGATPFGLLGLGSFDLGRLAAALAPNSTGLIFQQQPGGAAAGQAFSTQPVVALVNGTGAVVTSFTGSVALSITSGSGTAGATLSGTATVQAVNGVATFTGVSIGTAGTGYTLTATTSGYPAVNSSSFNVVAPCTKGGLTASATAPGTVTLTASATCGGTALYRYWTLAPGGTWQKVQDYTTAATYAWNTAGLAAGTYWLEMDAKNQGASVDYQTYALVSYTIAPAACTGAKLSATPQTPSTSIQLAASSSCSSALYRFWVWSSANGWQRKQDYSSAATYLWDASSQPAGTYWLEVDAKAQGSTASYDSYALLSYTLSSATCTGLNASSSAASVTRPASATVTGSATCPASATALYRFWLRAPGGTWQKVQDYGTAATYTLQTNGVAAGVYWVEVDAKAQGSAADFDQFQLVPITVK